jgi:hypothetical protein
MFRHWQEQLSVVDDRIQEFSWYRQDLTVVHCERIRWGAAEEMWAVTMVKRWLKVQVFDGP